MNMFLDIWILAYGEMNIWRLRPSALHFKTFEHLRILGGSELI